MNDRRPGDLLRALPQYLLPHHAISRLTRHLARMRSPWLPRVLDWFVRRYRVDLEEAAETDLARYETFNAFFTRALRPGARPVASEPDALVSPVDAAVSQIGPIDGTALVQAKGMHYTAAALLGSVERAALFSGGHFATLYLSPRDYHRIHMPVDGVLRETVYIPGRLFSVADHTVRTVPNLFARNERMAAIFDTPAGPMALVMVGALNVGSIETVWAGEVAPRSVHAPETVIYRQDEVRLARGEEMGRFNLGSTVILLFAKDRMEWQEGLAPESKVRVGERIGCSCTARGYSSP